MNKSISVVLTVILMITFTSCKKDVNSEINKRYMNMESYSARADVTVTGNKSVETYKVYQAWRNPSDYRLEILSPENMKGTVYIFKDGVMKYKSRDFKSSELSKSYTDGEYDFIDLADFLKKVYESGNTSGFIENADGKIVITSSGNNERKDRFSQTLVIDGKSYKPESMSTFNIKGDEVLRVSYTDFEINPVLDEKMFAE